MKTKIKLALVAIAAVTILCGFKYSNREGSDIPSDGQQMEILHYHGYTYVCYRFYEKSNWSKGYSYGYGGAGLVHDPDCKCGRR